MILIIGKNLVIKRFKNAYQNYISKTPWTGIGKPEPLKHDLNGYWSRRINEEHRIVYTVKDNRIKVISLRFHYK